MGVLNDLIFGVKQLLSSGTEVPERSNVNFAAPLVATDNAGSDRTDISITPDFGAQEIQTTGGLTVGGVVTLGSISPALTANANDWAPTGIDTVSVVKVQADGAYTITGISAGQVDGQVLWIINKSQTYALVLNHLDVLSAAANRITNFSASDVTLAAGAGAVYIYDGDDNTWQFVAR